MKELGEALGRRLRSLIETPDTPERCLGEALFALMGHLAKADGRVNDDEIAFAERFVRELKLDDAGRERAVELYNLGRAPNFDLGPWLTRCRNTMGPGSDLAHQLLTALARSALSDGRLTLVERGALERIALGLGFKRTELDELLEGLRRPPPPGSDLTELQALRILGLSPPWKLEQVVQAYRQRISALHPDRLAGQGVQGEELAQAAAGARRVREAYERLRRARD